MSGSRRNTGLVTVLLGFLTACAGVTSPTSLTPASSADLNAGTSSLHGVVSVNGVPKPGVNVLVRERLTQTDENGRFSYRGLAEGVYRVHLSLHELPTSCEEGNSISYRLSTRIGAPGRGDLEIDLPVGSAQIRFLDLDGKPMKGIRVRISGSQDPDSSDVLVAMSGAALAWGGDRGSTFASVNAVTDDGGCAVFPALVAGRYRFTRSYDVVLDPSTVSAIPIHCQFKPIDFTVVARESKGLTRRAVPTYVVSGDVELPADTQLFMGEVVPVEEMNTWASTHSGGSIRDRKIEASVKWRARSGKFSFPALISGTHEVRVQLGFSTPPGLLGLLHVDGDRSDARITLKRVESEPVGYAIVELPRPNSGEFTTEEATARKSEIYSLTPTRMMPEWGGPYAFGFSVHVSASDEVFVYPSIYAAKVTLSGLAALWKSTCGRLYGNPMAVLITSERDPKKSKIFPGVVDVLFEPSVQLFYLKVR